MTTRQKDNSNLNFCLGFISFLVWPIGFIAGTIYIGKENEADRHTGKICYIAAVIGLIFGIMISVPLNAYLKQQAIDQAEQNMRKMNEVIQEEMEEINNEAY